MKTILLLSQIADPAQQVGALNTQILDYLKLLLVLAAVLILAYVATLFWIPRMMGFKRLAGGPIRVVARYPLEPRKALYIIKAGGDFFLVGTSEGDIHYLTRLDSQSLEAYLQEQSAQPRQEGDFSRLLRGLKRSKDT